MTQRVLPLRLLPLVALFYGGAATAEPVPNTGTPKVVQAGQTPNVAAQAAATVWMPGRYDIRALAVPDGYSGAIATNIDTSGQMFGYAFNGGSYSSQTRRAVKWSPGGVVTKLGPDNATDGSAVGLIDNKVVYWTRAKDGGVDKIMGYVGATAIPGFAPRGVHKGKAFGWKYNSPSLPSAGGGYIWPSGETFTNLGQNIYAMNGAGVIAGTGRVPSHEYTYELSYGTTSNYMLRGRYGVFYDIDGSGVAVGYRSSIPNSPHGDMKAYRYKPSVIDEELGTFGGKESAITGTTLDGDALVGWAEDSAQHSKAFIYTHGRMFPLEGLADYPPAVVPSNDAPGPPPTPQMWIAQANAINEKGEICGTGYSSGKVIPFVLKPKSGKGLVAVNSEALKAHIVGRVLPAISIDRKAAVKPRPN